MRILESRLHARNCVILEVGHDGKVNTARSDYNALKHHEDESKGNQVPAFLDAEVENTQGNRELDYQVSGARQNHYVEEQCAVDHLR